MVIIWLMIIIIWLVVFPYPSETWWLVSSSVGMMKFPIYIYIYIYGKIIHSCSKPVIIKTCQNKNTTMEFSKMQDSSTKKCWNLLNLPVTSLHHVKWRTQNFSRHWDASGRTNEAPRRCVLNWGIPGIPQNGNFSKDNGYSPSNFGYLISRFSRENHIFVPSTWMNLDLLKEPPTNKHRDFL